MAVDNINWHKDQPAPKALIKIVQANFPRVPNVGIYVCRNVAGTKMKSPHAEGRALDIGLNAFNPAEVALGDQLFRILIRDAMKSGIDNIIWNKQIWSVSHGGPPREWSGKYPNGAPKDPHTDHIHVEWTRAGSQLQRLHYLELEIAILRQGMEEIAAHHARMA